jgi:H+/Cl- antiporter ClcA
MRSRAYRRLLVVSIVVGIVVSIASWGFLELTHYLQQWVYTDLPEALGYDDTPAWWPIPVLAVAGTLVGFAVARLPGRGGHEPSAGLDAGDGTSPVELPGVVLAATATIGLGLVLGPEAPLIALGTGVALLLVSVSRREMPDQARTVIAAAGAFAALATIFGSPIIGAIIIIEAAGIGGPTLPLVLLPGLTAAGFGSLVFLGIGKVTGLSSDAYALPPLTLPAYDVPRLMDFLWTVGAALVAAMVVFGVLELAKGTKRVAGRNTLVLVPSAAVLVGVIAFIFEQVSDYPGTAVLFSGQDEMSEVLKESSTVSLGVLAFLLLCKALAWGLSMGVARGGPTFPAIFLGMVGGLLAAHLPGFSETAAVGAFMAAAVVAVLRLPLSAIVLTALITQAGAGLAPLIILAVIVAYIATLTLDARRGSAAEPGDAVAAGERDPEPGPNQAQHQNHQ